MVVGTNLWSGNKKKVVRTKRTGVKENKNTRMIYKTTILVSRHKYKGNWDKIILIREQIQEHVNKNYRCNRNKQN
jgi:hypothetical protein